MSSAQRDSVTGFLSAWARAFGTGPLKRSELLSFARARALKTGPLERSGCQIPLDQLPIASNSAPLSLHLQTFPKCPKTLSKQREHTREAWNHRKNLK